MIKAGLLRKVYAGAAGFLGPSKLRASQMDRTWIQDETNGVLRHAVEAYLTGSWMTPEHIAAMRDYLRQWIVGSYPGQPEIDVLRAGIDGLTSRSAIADWLEIAMSAGIDPL